MFEFEDACEMLFPCLCTVGGASTDVVGHRYGQGCFVGRDYVLTAAHVADAPAREHEQLTVMHYAGAWSCDVVLCNPVADIAVLRLGDQRASNRAGRSLPNSFPKLLGERMRYGKAVGYFSRLHREDQPGGTSHTYFAAGHLSFMVHEPSFRWGLSAGFAEEGFSGSPVFSTAGKVLGVVTSLFRVAQPSFERVPQLVSVPLVSPLYKVADEFAAFLGT